MLFIKVTQERAVLGGVRRSEDKDIKAALIPFIAETEVKL